MGKPEFVHLHVHSDFSLLDGACRFDVLINRCKELNMGAVALTDHGNLFGAIGFYQACTKAGIKPIMGCEVYIAPGNRRDRGGIEGRSAHHLLLLAKDYEGYLNLCKLSSIGFLEGFYYKPRIDFETLSRHSKGLIATSSCLAGQIPQAIIDGDFDSARKLLGTYLDIFGPEDYYLEIQDHGIEEQHVLIRELRKISASHNLRLIATNDSHYVQRDDADFHDILLCIQTGKTRNDTKRLKFDGDQFYFKSAEEMLEVFSEIPEACRETLAVAERCNVKIPFGQTLLPVYHPPAGETPEEYLRFLAEQGLVERYGDGSENHRDRFEMELDCLIRMGFASYFLVVWDFIRYARLNDIPVGPGRGSAAGSLIAYCLRITDIDPIEHGLIFERFLNPERISMPDIDIDFCFENRGRVIDYVKQKYGKDNVAQIITFGTLKPKNAVRDVGRAMELPLATADQVARLIPAMMKVEKGSTAMDTALRTVPDLKRLYDGDDNTRLIIDYARKMEGMARHASTHAAGIVISDVPIMDVVPVYKPPDSNDIATQYTMTQVEDIGLLKMDFLGLKNLTVIENTLKSIRQNQAIEINWDAIPLNDPKSYKMLAAGSTFGVFQLESGGMTKLVRDLGPTSFEDLTALLALYRPGPLGSGMHEDYVKRKHGQTPIVYDHELLEPILRETYGVILYQEQVMKIAQVVAGFSLGDADLMRRAMGKKKAEEMEKQRAKFIDGACSNGLSRPLAEEIYRKIEYFSGYGFNKSHSAAYAVISFRTAYLKAHYPTDYMAALLTNAIGSKVEDMRVYFAEAAALKIRILPPDVNESEKGFSVREGSIRFGLAAVKNVGEGAVEGVIAARQAGGPFRSFDDFCCRVDLNTLNGRMLECLIKVGAFDSLRVRRSQLLQTYQNVTEAALDRQKEALTGQGNLFDIADSGEKLPSDIAPAGGSMLVATFPDIPEIPRKEKLQFEKELIGHYISGHPFDDFAADREAFAEHTISAIPRLEDESECCIVGRISAISTRADRTGAMMAFVTLEDAEGITEILVFRNTYEQYGPLLEAERVVRVRGRISARGGENKIVANNISRIEDVRDKHAKAVEIELDPDSARNGAFADVHRVIRSCPGNKLVSLVIGDVKRGQLIADLGKQNTVRLSHAFITELLDCPCVRQIRFRCE